MAHKQADRPMVIAGPCAAESLELLEQVAEHLIALSQELDFDLWFKSSFTKANRTSGESYQGNGISQTMEWFQKIKTKYKVKILTDIHESYQAKEVAEVCDALQIPAFLCRQTELLDAAIQTGRMINVKKGQFISHDAAAHIVQKAQRMADKHGVALNMALTERGNVFGYEDLIVDMSGLARMSKAKVPVIFDITHSCQKPGGSATTAGQRQNAAMLARAATATGYLSGYFLETHINPAAAKSDSATQLDFKQSAALLKQIIPLWRQAQTFAEVDPIFDR